MAEFGYGKFAVEACQKGTISYKQYTIIAI